MQKDHAISTKPTSRGFHGAQELAGPFTKALLGHGKQWEGKQCKERDTCSTVSNPSASSL